MSKNDWQFWARAFGWAFLMCESINAIAFFVLLIVGLSAPNVFGWAAISFAIGITILCQIGVISSTIIAIVRRRAFENAEVNDWDGAFATYCLNMGLLIGLTVAGSMTFSYFAGISASLILNFSYVLTAVLIGSLAASPFLIPLVMTSHIVMTRNAKRYLRVVNA